MTDKRKSQQSRITEQCRNLSLNPKLNDQLLTGLFQLNPQGFRDEYLLENVLSKYNASNGVPESTRRERAIAKWLAREKINEELNERLNYIPPVSFGGIPFAKLHRFIQRRILAILGDVPPEEALIGNFSGGASTSRSRLQSLPGLKYSGRADITSAAAPWFAIAISQCPGWDPYLCELNFVKGNDLFTVPKSTEIDRVAAKEPDINMWLQKGVGNFIRHQLKAWRIDLNDQTRNQRMAKRGSIDGSLATIDLSSASDSVTLGLCESLLPPLWFNLLVDLRSPYTCIDGEYHMNEMMSSMGNGFTFELESLLFYAIVSSVYILCDDHYRLSNISVYGDDIICPTHIAELVMEVLNWYGFSVNSDKSFWFGSFRESCGKHYCNGVDVSPFFVREPVTRLTDLINILNKMRKWSIYEDAGRPCPILREDYWDLWHSLQSEIPSDLKGGFDYEVDNQLVSYSVSKRFLVPRKRHQVIPDENAYVHWLNTTWERQQSGSHWTFGLVLDDLPDISFVYEGVSTSDQSVARNEFRARRTNSANNGITRRIPAFAGEL